MRPFMLLILTALSSVGFIQPAISSGIDPDLIDPEMSHVMYLITPKDIKTTAYKNGQPSSFDIKLCKECIIKSYALKKDAEILLNEQPIPIQDLIISLIKKDFDNIQLGLNRNNKTITYLYLGGISELTETKPKQEPSNAY